MARWALSSLLTVLVLSACSSGIEQAHFRRIDKHLEEGMPEEAAVEIQEAGRDVYGDLNELLYRMDLGYTLHLASLYEPSSQQLISADKLAADLYTQSLSAEAGSMFTNDLGIPYRGERYELALVNIINALNYVMMGKLDDALVEIRRLDTKFRAFQAEYEGRYAGDAFGLYLSALIYWFSGELDDAFIAGRNAMELYASQQELFGVTPPRALARDMIRWSRVLGVEPPPGTAELAGETHDLAAGGEIVVIHHLGPGPRKIERVVELSMGQGFVFLQAQDVRSDEQKDFQRTLSAAKGLASGTQITVAYPVFEQPPMRCTGARVVVEGCGEATSTLVENVSAIARIALEDRMKHEWGKIVARAVTKFVTARLAGEVAGRASNNSTVGMLAKIFTQAALSATEQADTRSWYTLPAQIHMTRLHCPPGNYTVRVEQMSNQGWAPAGGVYPEIQVNNGDKVFLHSACF